MQDIIFIGRAGRRIGSGGAPADPDSLASRSALGSMDCRFCLHVLKCMPALYLLRAHRCLRLYTKLVVGQSWRG